jgi:precorrin-6B methylase 2
MTRSKTVSLRAGERLIVDLTVDDPNDRVSVQYVPTPADIVDEMIKLADVNGQDVVYEPGCGDARITIAAVKAGAKRGVGIDIDPERVAESRGRVKQAGLDGKIDIRLGDALDIRDLSAATVVFLYMGDHFNMLIRPILWRELKVGARVVSHRFTMGEWKPDKTMTVGGFDGIGYELHIWTVTEELKRKAKGLPKKVEAPSPRPASSQASRFLRR